FATTALELASRAGCGDLGLLLPGLRGYPAALRDAAHPIEVVYYQGRPDIVSRRCIALVGTRRPSRAGEQLARRLGQHFAASGFTVLSGLADGIDTMAHRAAIDAGGATAAVLGTPLTAVYPPGNAELQRRLARDHLIVSHVPIVRHARQGVMDSRRFFRERNAILAALAEAVVVVEAGDRSGALICARHALDCGRRVFIPDRCRLDGTFSWPERLLRRGAIGVRAIGDIDERLAR
ncbi:MAG: DNA-processing protein DprA, partial [Steroidobacteraceae bacterium]